MEIVAGVQGFHRREGNKASEHKGHACIKKLARHINVISYARSEGGKSKHFTYGVNEGRIFHCIRGN